MNEDPDWSQRAWWTVVLVDMATIVVVTQVWIRVGLAQPWREAAVRQGSEAVMTMHATGFLWQIG